MIKQFGILCNLEFSTGYPGMSAYSRNHDIGQAVGGQLRRPGYVTNDIPTVRSEYDQPQFANEQQGRGALDEVFALQVSENKSRTAHLK